MESKLIFLDTETTGNGEGDYLCSVAFKQKGGEIFESLFKPPVPICLEAMSVTHITNKKVEGCDPFQGSEYHRMLTELFNEQDYILVAHNAEFDLKMLNKEGIFPKQYICTMKVARHLDHEDKIPNYKMQYIRYFMELDIDADAHNAADDIIVLEAIFERLKEKMGIEEMLKVTREPFLLRKLSFGKHKGLPFDQIPRDYLVWLRRQDKIEGDLLYTLNHYINKV